MDNEKEEEGGKHIGKVVRIARTAEKENVRRPYIEGVLSLTKYWECSFKS